jgi:hypothetical protein
MTCFVGQFHYYGEEVTNTIAQRLYIIYNVTTPRAERSEVEAQVTKVFPDK